MNKSGSEKIRIIVSIAIKNLRSKKKLLFVLTALLYLFTTTYYMGPSITHCTDTLYGFGDNTAGPVWRFSIEPEQSVFGSYEKITNYPVGENLYAPTVYSLSGQTALIWTASKIAGPVCGYNIVNIVGFVASALAMYGLMYAITKKRWIAVLAGYAVSFSPYFQMKVGGHPGYGYQAFLILAAWAFLNLVKRWRVKEALLLAVSIAVCFYFDPYLSLLAICVVVPLGAAWLMLSLWRLKKREIIKGVFIQQLRILAVSLGVFLLLLAPLAVVTLKNRTQISSSVAAARGNVLFEARACSNLPHEYLLPFVLHPTFKKVFGSEYVDLVNSAHDGFSCGIGEDTVGISLVMLMIGLFGGTVFVWEKLNKRRLGLRLGYDNKLIVYGFVLIIFTAAALALPPVKILNIPTPSLLLLDITSTWRTLTRLYVVVNFGVIVIAGVVLSYFGNKFKKNKKLLILAFIIVAFGVFVEYQAFKPFSGNSLSTFSYKTDVPQAYRWLKEQKDISVIAEYPLERAGGESNANAYYLSMQVYHKKTLFNANNPLSYEERFKSSLKDISDPQTIDVLSSLGVDVVVIHGVEEEVIKKIPGLEIMHVEAQSPFNILAFTPLVTNDVVVIAKLKGNNVDSMLTFSDKFARNTTIIKSAADWQYEAINLSKMEVTSLPGEKETDHTLVDRCFSVALDGEGEASLNLTIDGVVSQPSILITPDYRKIHVLAKESIVLDNSKGFNMKVQDLGCPGM